MNPELGVCYYPEHWSEEMWATDAARMVETGLSWVRIGEFAWSRIEPTPDDLHFDWLDRAIEVLGTAGLKVVLGTPTATPPRWMLEKHPDMLAVDAQGQLRKFGSRRHYCFSHQGYIAECTRIVRIMGERYGRNPLVAAWQIDNEYGCHDTTVSYSQPALRGFQRWLANQYGSVDALNEAWGNVFWSMEYASFDQIDLPNLTVTEPNPAHVLAFRRFSSDQVVAFNKAQVDVLRPLTNAPLLHNYMGRILDFDHFKVGADLDIATWDSYPIGFLSDRLEADEAHKKAFLQQGDPDMQAFHHDLYRAVGRGRWWVMEQQPGPVNWAPYNPAPLPGMVRLWSLEAVAHGAEVVSYFRWRQAPFAQEQMHAGLLTPNNKPAPALAEARQTADDLAKLGALTQTQADVAILFDYASDWAWAAQPQGVEFNYFRLVFSTYRALRRAGLSVDFISATGALQSGYKLILAPGLATLDGDLEHRLTEGCDLAILGPRTGAITRDFQIPISGRPGLSGLDCEVDLVESLPPNVQRKVEGGGAAQHWVDRLSGDAPDLLTFCDRTPALKGENGLWYLAGFPDEALWDRIVAMAAQKVDLPLHSMPDGLRRRETEQHFFLVNYTTAPVLWDGHKIAACDVTILRKDRHDQS
ncbi:Beta-galactosidase [Ruegeria denitrificans]|uniref:Beta-galactosidase n=1 Tax=Ruegeria denitrificans TaxID=1715692 RepID=A0A0P1I9B0_9RHOB|nr:beta-galactosidase [Ruegeria denitrificans]CUJ99206.1 Beta-galactosidase [Ruegeria denitrificans]